MRDQKNLKENKFVTVRFKNIAFKISYLVHDEAANVSNSQVL